MIESVAADLQKKDADALKQVRAGLAELKKVFPAAVPPRTPVKDHCGHARRSCRASSWPPAS